MNRIMLCFEHTPCDIEVDVHTEFGTPDGRGGFSITESVDAYADRIRPWCPACKTPMQYTGFVLNPEREEPNKPFPGSDP